MSKSVRVGIDIGGTHTKAVAIDNSTHEIIGKSGVKTTHDHPRGVAEGVAESFRNCLAENGINAKDVTFVAHSTTLATNALLEGDVAVVGVFGMAKGGPGSLFAKRRLKIDSIQLGNGKLVNIVNSFVKTKNLTEEAAELALDGLLEQGAQAVVVGTAFGADNSELEAMVQTICVKRGIPCTIANDVTKLHGLARRIRAAAINASILPKMLEAANSAEAALRETELGVPLMVMRGDGGTMEISETKKRPVLAMLSGPAASVMGSLMCLQTSNGICFEVGGTATNIGVIKNGRPAIDCSIVGGLENCISSLDVRVVGCAGGSMVRANKNGITDIGPRSAHAAGLDYASYSDPASWEGGEVEFFSPKPGDPADYVAVRFSNGARVAITNTCAAHVLGLVRPEHFSHGNTTSAKTAMDVLAKHCGSSAEEIAGQIMERAYAKIEPVVLGLAEKHKLERSQLSFIGLGGGAAALVVYFSRKMGIKYSIPENAEAISPIGLALAKVREVVERIVPSPSRNELLAIKTEAINRATESGAAAESIEVHIELDSQNQKATATAADSTELKTAALLKETTLEEAMELAREDMEILVHRIRLLERSSHFYVFGEKADPGKPAAIRILDGRGFIRVQRESGIVMRTTVKNHEGVVKELWEKMSVRKAEAVSRPDFYVCAGARVMDFSANDLEPLMSLIGMETAPLDPDEELFVVAANAKPGTARQVRI